MKRKVVGLIIAKKNSTRLENKNFRDFNGKPMFVWNLEKMLKIFDKVYVSSDYDLILKEAEKSGAISIKRPKNLCGKTPNIPVYQHAFSFMGKVDGIVAVQANSPTVEAELILQAKKFLEKGAQEVMTLHKDGAIYGSIWAISKNRLENYPDPYNPKPDKSIIDNSIDIHTNEDIKKALCQ